MSNPENDPTSPAFITAFAEVLKHLGWVEGKNIRVDEPLCGERSNPFQYPCNRIGRPVAGRASRKQHAGGRGSAATDAHNTDRFRAGDRSCRPGFVQSLARPGGNITGFSSFDTPLMGKWLQLLKEIAPNVTRVAVIFNPDTAPYASLANRAIEAAAPSFGITVTLAPVHDDAAIEEAVTTHARELGGGLISLPSGFNTTHRDVIIGAATRHCLPLVGTPDFSQR
jgi:putative ABC transport system substrate-binding protein